MQWYEILLGSLGGLFALFLIGLYIALIVALIRYLWKKGSNNQH